jgi:hypothetical protein
MIRAKGATEQHEQVSKILNTRSETADNLSLVRKAGQLEIMYQWLFLEPSPAWLSKRAQEYGERLKCHHGKKDA